MKLDWLSNKNKYLNFYINNDNIIFIISEELENMNKETPSDPKARCFVGCFYKEYGYVSFKKSSKNCFLIIRL